MKEEAGGAAQQLTALALGKRPGLDFQHLHQAAHDDL